MRQIDRDSLPYIVDCLVHKATNQWYTFWARLAASWWGMRLGSDCSFWGRTRFSRYPRSRIIIGHGCRFRSSPVSNLIGVNRPCILATLSEGAEIDIGRSCGFSGTVINCAVKVVLGEQVRCGSNTWIIDTDMHWDDARSGVNEPVFIERRVWLGANVSVLKGVTIGENTIVAAGSMVTKSLPANVVAGGMPAKVLKKIDR